MIKAFREARGDRLVNETPEQHTARVLCEVDRLLRDGAFPFVSMETDADNMFRADCGDMTTGPHQTYIGALSALIEAHRDAEHT